MEALPFESIEPGLDALYIEVPASQIVWLQSLFESYEGAGTVRTMDVQRSLVAILTTPSMRTECERVLNSVRSSMAWRSIVPDSHEIARGFREKIVGGDFRGSR